VRFSTLLLFIAIGSITTSCTTLSNRRDLFNPTEQSSMLPQTKGGVGRPLPVEEHEAPLPPPGR
jgi:hypothetical protein